MENVELPSAPQPNTSPLEETPKIPPAATNRPKLNIIFWGILIVVLLSAGTIFAFKSLYKTQVSSQPPTPPQITTIPTPASNPTTNWKTYTNSLYHYEFQYPPNWKIEQFKGDKDEISDEELPKEESINLRKYTPDGRYGYSILIGVSGSEMGKKISCPGVVTDPTCLEQFFDSPPAKKYQVISINQVPAIKFFDLANYRTILFVQNYTLIKTTWNPPSENLENIDQTVMQILSSFRFLD